MVVGDVTTGTDVLVVGGGPGGYVAAIRAGQLDLDVTLVEKDAVGGTCLNYGCIPSKAYVSAADVAHRADAAESMGIHADPAVDLATTREWKDGVVRRLTKGVESLCEAAGVEVIEGAATFTGANAARIAHAGEGQGSETIEFEHAVVGTGSQPIALPNFDFDDEHILSSKGALALDSVPDSLLVVGAGYIGMELSTVFQKLGSDVTVIEMLDDALPGYEDDVTDVVRDRAEELGVDFHFGLGASDWRPAGEGVRVTATPAGDGAGSDGAGSDGDGADSDGDGAESADGDGNEEKFDAEKVLVAVGREPYTEDLGLDALGVEPDEDGFLATDSVARTGVDHVYAVGDVAGEPMLAHTAMAEGEVAAEVIAGEASALDHQAFPAAVFTDPEIGTVGMTESEAADAGFDPVVGQVPLRSNGRALTLDEKEGFVRIVADDESDFVLGGQVVAPEAAELVAEIGLAIELGATLEDVAGTIHTHPTLSEGVHEAALAARGEAIHAPNR